MVQGYYTLQEAAKVLGLAPDELKQMAQRNQIRSFQDRGTWRFRAQDIQELARQRGVASDPELLLGEAPGVKPADSPVPRPPKSTPPKSAPPKSAPPKSAPPKSGPPKSPQPKTPRAGTKAAVPEVFDFDLGAEHVGVGQEKLGGDKRKPDSKPTPKPGSDSDVRLVADGSDMEFVFDAPSQGGVDSNVKLVGEDKPLSPRPKTPRKPGMPPESPVPKKPAQPAAAEVDSGVRLVPLDSDSDVKIVGASSDELPLGEMPEKSSSDSDIRLEPAEFSGSKSDEGLLTEEINLDEELRKQEAQAKKPQAKVKPKAKGPGLPAVSPFELSESQLKLPASEPGTAPRPESSEYELTPAAERKEPSSDDFDLTPAKTDSSDFDLNPADSSSEDFSLELPDESEIRLEPGSSGELKGPSSGISLGNPVDAGISLEQGGEGSDEIEFELSLDAEATPKPASAKKAEGDSSEFELSLDADDNKLAGDAATSDSEFELTLDDSGGLALEDDAPQVKAGEDKDIFETDFEVPALEDESGSQVQQLDTDLDSSDFDLALGDSEIASEEESGSQVVALDEEEADDAAATVAAQRGQAGEFDQIAEEEPAAEIEEAEGEEGPVREVVREKVLRPAPWGALPVALMLPCVILMFVVGVMGFELVQNMNSYKPAGFMTKAIGGILGQKPK
jgi:excisionase family DNA binding protein